MNIDQSLRQKARRYYPRDAACARHNRRQYLAAIVWLRTQSKTGWIVDRPVEKV